jgi:hypothetical protein
MVVTVSESDILPESASGSAHRIMASPIFHLFLSEAINDVNETVTAAPVLSGGLPSANRFFRFLASDSRPW